MGVQIPNSGGHTKAWESISKTRGAKLKHGILYAQLGGATFKGGSLYAGVAPLGIWSSMLGL